MKILCVGYRSWALDIYKQIKKAKKHKVLILKKVNIKRILNFKPDYLLFYGWSNMVSDKLINTGKCIMLHPSKLPLYRGGSPIQNQIIRGVNISAVTLFRMNKNIDQGNIILQKKISLEGSIDDIFKRITNVGYELTLKMLKGNFKEKKQPKNSKIYKRRRPHESQITLNEIKNKSAKYLYNKIRMLGDPYPNAYILTKDKRKILLKVVKIK